MLDYEAYKRVMDDIRNKWEKAEQLAINCDPKSIFALSEVDVLLERYKEYKHGKEWRVLSKDQEIIKKEFATSCTCEKKKW